MVLGLLTAIAACPAIIGTTEAVRQGQNQNAKEKHRGQKTNLVASCVKNSSQSAQINGGMVVLKNHKVRFLLPKSPTWRGIYYRYSYPASSSTSRQSRTSTSPSKTSLNSRSPPATLSQATSSHTLNTTGAGKAKDSSRPSRLTHQYSIGCMWTKIPTK